jgi:pimeloyl-ACP methyl ester carboxylesterase
MTTYRTVSIDGLNIFYREAGSRNNPTILLLHGFPTSSHYVPQYYTCPR